MPRPRTRNATHASTRRTTADKSLNDFLEPPKAEDLTTFRQQKRKELQCTPTEVCLADLDKRRRLTACARSGIGDSGIGEATADESHVSANGSTIGCVPDSASTSAESSGSLVALRPQIVTSTRSAKYVGAHISGQGGLPRCAQLANDIRAKCLCVFVRIPRRWKCTPLSNDVIRKFKEKIESSRTLSHDRLLARSCVLVNAGAAADDLLKKTRDAIEDEMHRCYNLGIAYYVIQPGSTQGKIDVAECLNRVIETINIALQNVSEVTILITNMCLQGYTVGGKFSELKKIFDGVTQKHRIGLCMDVLSAYAAGYNVSTQDGLDLYLKDLDDSIGIHNLRAVRMMDSELPIGSHLHRPTAIGFGWIGNDGFKVIMNDPRLNHIPMFLDTGENTYQRDMELLYSLCKD